MREQFHRATAFAVAVAAAVLLRGSAAADNCGTVKELVSACSAYVMYGAPDPQPGSPCCAAMTTIKHLADIGSNRRGVCRCMMDLAYSFNATSIATVPGFCEVWLGFAIDPNTDCENIDQYADRGSR